MRHIFAAVRDRCQSDRGQSLVLFAGGLVVFIGLVGMSVDVGQLVYKRTDLQKTVDAAAFAGAQDLPTENDALLSANQYVAENGDGALAAQVSVTTANTANDTITVTAQDTVNFFFLDLLGMDSSDVTATATVRIAAVTGYVFDETDIFPYAVWGGPRTVPTDPNCSYGICPGSTQVFRSNHYEADSNAAAPEWDVNSNNFKGYFHAGGDVVQVDENQWQTFSKGGNALGQQPYDALVEHFDSGRPIIVPVITAARCTGGCNNIDFKIVAWVALDITELGTTSQPWKGVVVEDYAISKGETDGGTVPPSDITTYTYQLVN